MSPRAGIVAIAARTPLGTTAEASAAGVRAGVGRLTEHPFLIDRVAEPVRMARDGLLDLDLMGCERVTEMATSVVREIDEKLALRQSGLGGIPLLLGLPEDRPGWGDAEAEIVRSRLDELSENIPLGPVELFRLGHASALTALETGLSWIESDRAELCIVAGADSYLEPKTLAWLDESRQLATSYHRSGFFPGEGAGAFAIASEKAAERMGLDSLAVIRSVATATESRLIKTDAVCLGEGLSECVGRALAALAPGETVDGIIGDINGERYRSEEWGFTLLRHAEALVDPTRNEVPASCWGDQGAASGPLYFVMAVEAGRRGWAQGERYLVWNSSEGGQRAAAVLELDLRQEGVRL